MSNSVDQKTLGIKVKLKKDYPIICESLERMGIKNDKERTIYPSCYCLKTELDDGTIQYSICHFKELFLLQNKPSTFNKIDQLRRATITYLLQKWGLVDVDDVDDVSEILTQQIGVVKHSDKRNYKIIHKFKQTGC
jgi:hypothetical protein